MLGIEILDFQFKRTNYAQVDRPKVYERMISERKRIAEEYRSEGAGEAARIIGDKDRDLKEITSEAYRQAQEIKGKADAEAANIYAKAYNRDPNSTVSSRPWRSTPGPWTRTPFCCSPRTVSS